MTTESEESRKEKKRIVAPGECVHVTFLDARVHNDQQAIIHAVSATRAAMAARGDGCSREAYIDRTTNAWRK